MVHPTETIRAACEELGRREAALARAFAEIGVPEWRAASPDFESLARIVTYQLLSTRAAATIWGRVLDWGGGRLEPEAVITCEDAELRGCGLSGPKVRHLKSIATAIHTGELPLHRLSELSDSEARKCLIKVKGIGPWTADVYLMSSLGRLDAFPDADVGLMEAFRILNDDDERLKPRAFLERARLWAPYRSVAAHLLWGFINFTREKSY